MSTTRPARSSARQSALRQQELEAEQARREAQRQLQEQQEQQRVLSQNTNGNPTTYNRDNDDSQSLTSSSRSLSPALSDSASLSSGSDGEDDGNSPDQSNRTTARLKSLASRTRGAISQQQQEEDELDPTKPFSDPNLPTYWEIAFVFGFLVRFKSLLRQNCPLHELSIEDLEAGLLAKQPNACIEEIHANLLSNMLNRKKAVDSSTWQKVLVETLDVKQRTGEMEYDQNPLRYYGNYYAIPPEDRINILKALVHWVLQEGVIIRQGIEDDMEYFAVRPFGIDQAKRIYWYFGEGTLRIFRETKNPKKKSTGWETVATNLDEIKGLANSFNRTASKHEKALQERLREDIIGPVEEKILQDKLRQERQEKKMLKLAELHQLAATRTTRTRSSNRLKQPKYTFDDDEDEFEEDEYDLHRRPSSRRRYNNDEHSIVDNTITGNLKESTEYGADSEAHEHPQYYGQEQGEQQLDHQRYKERSASVEDEGSSNRSSVGRDSDSSIRVALQRTRVDAEDEDGDYKFKEDQDDDETLLPRPSISQPYVFIPARQQSTAYVGSSVSVKGTTPPSSAATEMLSSTSTPTPASLLALTSDSSYVPVATTVFAPAQSTAVVPAPLQQGPVATPSQDVEMSMD
ncbi:hypothetical protein EDD11_005910 [Mortierella claussenii]|nr:hypothetical protein EDD11_005910 [Mortierella claussenii]